MCRSARTPSCSCSAHALLAVRALCVCVPSNRLCLQNTAPDASSKFLDVARSYEILSTPALRDDFDRHGSVRSKAEREADEAAARWRAQAREQQARSSYYNMRDYRYYVDPVAQHRAEVYARSADDDALASSARLTGANFEYMMTSVTSQPHTNEGWVILVHSATCEPCQALHPTWAAFARSMRQQFKGLIRVGRINSEFERGLIQKLSVRYLPAILAISISPTSGVSETKSSMTLSRDARGALIMPTASQLRDFASASIWPTSREGKVQGPGLFGGFSGGFNVPLMDVTMGLGGAGKDMKAAALSLATRLQRFQSEWNSYPDSRRGEMTSPFVHVYVISRSVHPSPLMRWAAHRFVDRMRFAHISLPLLAHSDTLLKELARAFPGVDLPLSVSEGSLVLVQRETNLRFFVPLVADGSRVEEEYMDRDSFATLLGPHMALHVPRLSGENFDRLCLPTFEGNPTADARASPQAHRECFILFAESQMQAQTALLGLFPRNAPQESNTAAATASGSSAAESTTASEPTESAPSDDDHPPSLPKHVQLGWMHPSEQSVFLSWLRAALSKHRSTRGAPAASKVPLPADMRGVLLRAGDSTFAPMPYTAAGAFDGSPASTRALGAWIASAAQGSAGTAEAPVVWVDGRSTQGGMPYPAPSQASASFGGAAQSLLYVLGTPLRLARMAFAAGSSSSDSSSSSSLTLFLAVLFTVVFLLTSSGLLRFVGN